LLRVVTINKFKRLNLRRKNSMKGITFSLLVCMLVLQAPPVLAQMQQQVSFQIKQGTDDAEEHLDSDQNGRIDLTSSDLELGCERGDGTRKQMVGLRFTDVAIPQGRVITNAYIQFELDKHDKTIDPFDVYIWAEDTDSAETFNATAYSITSRPKLIDSVNWTIPAGEFITIDERYNTSDITSLVQQLVDRAAWNSGSAMAFFIKGEGLRETESFNGEAEAAPTLFITYEMTAQDSTDMVNAMPKRTYEMQINQGSDDMEEFLSGSELGNTDLTSSDLELGAEYADGSNKQMVGVRFTNIPVKKNRIITNAYIEFELDKTNKTADPFDVHIWAEDTDNAATYTVSEIIPFELTARPKLMDSVQWTIPVGEFNTIDERYPTSNIKTLVQQLVNRDNWEAGNAMAFYIKGEGTREVESYEGEPTAAAKLFIEFAMNEEDHAEYIADSIQNALPEHVVLNEVMVKNISTIKDDKGNYSAWVELFNPTNAPVNLSGYTLTNDQNDLSKWTINNLTLAAKEFKIIWLSGDDTQGTAGSEIIAAGSNWKYLDNGTDQGSAWTEIAFNDATWSEGAAELGYGDGDEVTVVSYGPDANNKYPTTYFRKSFTIADKSTLGQLKVDLIRDDGAIIFINGVEVARDNLPEGEIDYLTLAPNTIAGSDESNYQTHLLNDSMLVNGTNVIAVRIHQRDLYSSDISFNLKMEGLGLGYHTNFTPSLGDTIFLANASSQVVSQLAISVNLIDNTSNGLSPDAYIDSVKYYTTATPESSNGEGLDILPNPGALVLNPYQNVNWQSFHKYKANLHTHTTNSDGSVDAHLVIDAYKAANYDILALTDHNKITWPWTNLSAINSNYENRDPEVLGMLAIEGNELSGAHHTGSYINAVEGNGAILNDAFSTMTSISGLGAFKHPGRYWNISTNYSAGQQYSLDWYQDFYERFPVIVGMEVYNQGDRYTNDRVLWDELLTIMMPERPIWGYSNDDMHSTGHYFRNYNYMLMPELTEEAFRTSMEEGASFFAYENPADGNPLIPYIDSITVHKANHTITIHAKDYTSIEWISGVQGTGASRTQNVVATGESFSYTSFTHLYVRAVVINSRGRIYTQPFGFGEVTPNAISSITGSAEHCEGTPSASFSVEQDNMAEQYHWILPSGISIIEGENTHSITADLSSLTADTVIQVYKTNLVGNSDTASFNIIIHPTPATPIISVLENTLTSSNLLGNQWYNQDGVITDSTGISLTCSETGDYYVITTSEPGSCASAASNTVTCTVSSTAIGSEPNIRVVRSFIEKATIEIHNNNSGYQTFEIIDALGKVVYTGTVFEKTTVSTVDFARGAYVIQFNNGQKQYFTVTIR
jgi:hypothetical protein